MTSTGASWPTWTPGARWPGTALVTAAVIKAVDRRFGPGHQDDAAVTAFISDARSRFSGADDEIYRAAAKRVVRKALGRESISDIDGPTIRRTERLLFPLMEELDRFLADARKLLDS